MSEDEHYPWCAAAQNMARPRSLQLIGPKCECAAHRESLRKTKSFFESDEGKNQMREKLIELKILQPKETK